MSEGKSEELELLGFLEKSHCVPILIALDKNGMMNRNQIYHELGETIRVVMKRIELLKQYGLIYEIKMKVKPYAKYINLTIKGKKVASRLTEIKDDMEVHYDYPISLFHFHFHPDAKGEFGKAIAIRDSMDENIIKVLDNLKGISTCPICSGTLHVIKEHDRAEWTCFECGFKREASRDELIKLWALERLLNPYID